MDGVENEFHGDMTLKRKRLKKPDKSTWSVEQQKMRRMKGDAYFGIRRTKNNPSSSNLCQQKPPRSIGSSCDSPKCKTYKNRHCQKFSESRRRVLFDSFWKEMDWGQKHAYVLSLVDTISPKQETKKGGGSLDQLLLFSI